MKKSKIKEALIGLAELKEKHLSDMALEMYATALEEYSEQQLAVAFQKAIKTLKFFPQPSEIVEIIEGDQFTKAEKAWRLVLTAIERFGIYESFFFPDPKINTAVDILGGWQKICKTPDTELPYLKNEFLKIYPHCSNEGKHCIGLAEMENRRNGQPYEILDWDGHPKMLDNKNEGKVGELVDNLVKKIGNVSYE